MSVYIKKDKYFLFFPYFNIFFRFCLILKLKFYIFLLIKKIIVVQWKYNYIGEDFFMSFEDNYLGILEELIIKLAPSQNNYIE